jgi:hypothetical protein
MGHLQGRLPEFPPSPTRIAQGDAPASFSHPLTPLIRPVPTLIEVQVNRTRAGTRRREEAPRAGGEL